MSESIHKLTYKNKINPIHRRRLPGWETLMNGPAIVINVNNFLIE